MTTKRIVFAVMCTMLLLTLVMTGVLAARIAPILQAFTNVPQVPAQPTETTEAAAPSASQEITRPTEDHAHVFDMLDHVQKPGCTTYGYSLYVCQCGKTAYRDVKQALGHTWDQGTKQEATCTQKGGMLYTCANCGTEELRNTKPATGHQYGPWEADPEDAYQEISTCLDCGEQQTRPAENPPELTQPTDPTQPTDATEPSAPTAPTDPTELTQPTNPTDPTDPTEGTQPTDPTEPSAPTEGTTPTETTSSTEATGPAPTGADET